MQYLDPSTADEHQNRGYRSTAQHPVSGPLLTVIVAKIYHISIQSNNLVALSQCWGCLARDCLYRLVDLGEPSPRSMPEKESSEVVSEIYARAPDGRGRRVQKTQALVTHDCNEDDWRERAATEVRQTPTVGCQSSLGDPSPAYTRVAPAS